MVWSRRRPDLNIVPFSNSRQRPDVITRAIFTEARTPLPRDGGGGGPEKSACRGMNRPEAFCRGHRDAYSPCRQSRGGWPGPQARQEGRESFPSSAKLDPTANGPHGDATGNCTAEGVLCGHRFACKETTTLPMVLQLPSAIAARSNMVMVGYTAAEVMSGWQTTRSIGDWWKQAVYPSPYSYSCGPDTDSYSSAMRDAVPNRRWEGGRLGVVAAWRRLIWIRNRGIGRLCFRFGV